MVPATKSWQDASFSVVGGWHLFPFSREAPDNATSGGEPKLIEPQASARLSTSFGCRPSVWRVI
jgi:hypothetical protein